MVKFHVAPAAIEPKLKSKSAPWSQGPLSSSAGRVGIERVVGFVAVPQPEETMSAEVGVLDVVGSAFENPLSVVSMRADGHGAPVPVIDVYSLVGVGSTSQSMTRR